MPEKKEVKVVPREGENLVIEVLADEIAAIAAGIKTLRDGRLKDSALILLIQHAAPTVKSGYTRVKISSKTVKNVLDGMESLAATYLKR